jgi:hypothetical protein
MRKFKYKNIILFQECGRWHADYNYNGAIFPLHREATKTKAQAYKYAQREVDYINKEWNWYESLQK